ncbi:hypothetical protein Hamer_G020994 [Homarus americanus]|uniref:Uncharacterized protein n=1 Tax=Homarus americanus TaxID=6706 RepID=A0A8J5JIT1_HOMAM|nr:hypothetical protein Hamer_G020994 [Homarus americanus]
MKMPRDTSFILDSWETVLTMTLTMKLALPGNVLVQHSASGQLKVPVPVTRLGVCDLGRGGGRRGPWPRRGMGILGYIGRLDCHVALTNAYISIISLASLHKVMVKTGNELPFANKSTRLDSEVADDVPWLLHADIYAFYNRKTGELEHLTNDSLHLDMTAYVEYLGECLQRDLPVLEEADYPPNVTSVFAAMRDEILVPFTCLVFISKDTVDESACIFYSCAFRKL